MISIIQFIHEDSEYDNLVAEAFSQRAKMAAAGIGSAIAAALAAVWAVKNKDEIALAIDSIMQKLGMGYENNNKIVRYVRNLFGLDGPEYAIKKIKELSNETVENIQKEIETVNNSNDAMIPPKTKKLLGTFMQKVRESFQNQK